MFIRPLSPEDYPAAASIQNAQNEPHHQTTAERMRAGDARYNLHYDPAANRVFARLTAEADGEVVGTGSYGHRYDDYAPDKFWVWFHVRVDYQNRGVDTAMFDAALNALEPYRSRSLWTCVRADFVPMAGYLNDRNFEEAFRSWGANLELQTFHPASFAPLESRLQGEGIHIRTFAELSDTEFSSAERDRKLLELHTRLEEDAPHFEPIISKAHPDFRDPDTLLESCVVAVHGKDYIGLASLHTTDSDTVLGCGLTGVSRLYRGRGVGTALKARAATWAKAQGYRTLNAGGAGANLPMLALNKRLGFAIEPAWITFVKTV